jgi:mono/diheme cytochrome c family protein
MAVFNWGISNEANNWSGGCGYCHGKNVGPVIRGRALPADAIKTIVRHGQNGMPAFRPTEITNSELDKLAQWISASKADPKELGK